MLLAGCAVLSGRAAAPPPAFIPVVREGEEVAAYVGGEPVLLRWVDQEVGLWRATTPPVGANPEGELAMRWEILQRWITRMLAFQEARRRGVTATLQEVDAAVRGTGIPRTQARMYQLLREHGVSQEDLRVRAQVDLYLLRFQQLLEREIASSMREEDVWAYYRSHPELFQHPEQVYAWVIAVRDPALAHRIADLARKGEDFGRLAELHSVHPTRSRRGEFGWLSRGGPAFEPLFRLSPGEVSDPIDYDGVWLVFKVMARRPAGLWPFAEVREEALRALVRERLAERQRELDRRLRASTRVEIRIPQPTPTASP